MNTNLLSVSGRIGSGKDVVASMIQFLTRDDNYKGTFNLQDEFEDWNRGLKIDSTWQIKKFAGKLKQIASILTGIPIEKFEDQEFKESYVRGGWDYVEGQPKINIINKEDAEGNYEWTRMTVRKFLQRLGTDGLRNGLHENVWVNALFADFVKSGYCINMAHLQNLHNTPLGIAEEVQSTYSGNWEKYISDYQLPKNTATYIDGSKWIITDTRFPNELQAVKDDGGVTIQLTRNSDVESDHISETALDNAEFDYILDNKYQTLEETFEDVVKLTEKFELS